MQHSIGARRLPCRWLRPHLPPSRRLQVTAVAPAPALGAWELPAALFVLGSSEGPTPSVSSSQVARSERGELFPTFVFLVRGDFCKLHPFSLKARPALVPHSQRGWRGHLCTGGLQPSVSLPAGVRACVRSTPAPAASKAPWSALPALPPGTQPRVRHSCILDQSSSPAQERCSHPPEQGTLSSPHPTPVCTRRGVSSPLLELGHRYLHH